MDIRTHEKQIYELLEKYPKFRDDLMPMLATIWYVQIEQSKGKGAAKRLSLDEFLRDYLAKNKMKNATSIDRAWRLVQNKNIHLRGEYYDKRRTKSVADTLENLGYTTPNELPFKEYDGNTKSK